MNSQDLIKLSSPAFLARRLQDGTMEEISELNPLPVTGGGSNGFLGFVGNEAWKGSFPLVTTAGAYSANDYVGALMTLTDIARVDEGSVLIQSIAVQVKSNQTGALSLLLFDAEPDSTTIADNGALAINAADVFKVKAAPLISTVRNLGTGCVYEIDNLALMLQPEEGRDLYAALVTNTAWTLASVADVNVDIKAFRVN